MSYVDPSQQDPNEDQSQVDAAQNAQKQQSQSASQPDSTPPATSGGGGSGIVSGGGVGGAQGAASASSAPQKPSSSGSWTNLNSYLSANQDQAADVGNKIADSINSQGSSAQNEIQNLNSGFQSDVQKNTVNEDQNSVNQAIQDAQNNALSQNDLSAFGSQANAQYNGPSDFTKYNGYSQAANDAQQAMTNANLAASESGRDVLLQNQFGNAPGSTYNQGENKLDQLLLEGSGGANTLNNAASQWSGLNTVLSGDVTAGNAAAQAAQAQTQKTAADAVNAFTSARDTQSKAVEDYLAAQKAGYSTDYNKLVNDLNAYNASGNLGINAQEAQMLGLTQGQKLYDLYQMSPQLGSQYVTQAAFDANKEITPQQQAELAALDQLGAAGNQAATNKYTNAALAGTQTADNSIDTSGFKSAVTNATKAYNDLAAKQLVGSGSGSDAFGYTTNAVTANNPFGGQITIVPSTFTQTGTASASATDSQSLADYLAGGGPSNGAGTQVNSNFGTDIPAAIQSGGVSALIPGGIGSWQTANTNYNTQQSLANQQAQDQAAQNLWNQIQAELQSSGYNNEVNIQ